MKHREGKPPKDCKIKLTKDVDAKKPTVKITHNINNNKSTGAQPVLKMVDSSKHTNSYADDLLKRVQKRSLTKNAEAIGHPHSKAKTSNINISNDKTQNIAESADVRTIHKEQKKEIHTKKDHERISSINSHNALKITNTQEVPVNVVEKKNIKVIDNSQSSATNPNDKSGVSVVPDIQHVNEVSTKSDIPNVNEVPSVQCNLKEHEKSTVEHEVSTVSEITKDNQVSKANDLKVLGEESTSKIPEVPVVSCFIKDPEIPRVLNSTSKVTESLKVSDIPKIPDVPTISKISEVPSIPTVPGISKIPGVSAGSEISQVASEPTVPGIPKVPGVSIVPGVSTESEISQVPSVPTVPGIPTIPGVSPVSEILQVASVPTVPGIPKVPGVSTVSESSQIASVPTIPGIPKVTGVSTVSEISQIASVPTAPGIPKATGVSTVSEISQIASVPTVPGIPNVPDVPVVPVIPKVPGIPNVPGIPKVPDVPTVPGIPKVLGVPIVPGIPNVPGVPIVPGIPNVPGVVSNVPGVPTVPSIPKSPVVTTVPAIPNVPGVPSVPGIPQVPGVPTIPGIPKIPGLPTVPGIPKAPGVPGIPGIPQAPGIPGAGPSIPLGIPSIQSNAPKVKQKVKTNNPMKPLYWNVIESRKIKGTIWETLDDNRITINITKFEEEFGVKKKEATVAVDQKEKEKAPGNTKISLLLPARQQNITIVLSKLHIPVIEIVEAMIKYDESILSPPKCELLLPILPTGDESALFDKYEDDAMNLQDCDLFIWLLLTAEGAAERLKAIIFKSMYEEEVNNLSKNINTVYLAFEFVQSNKAFHRWLELILAYGNYLNGTSNRGGAYAFRVDILSKLVELKSTDNKKNFLFYLVEYVAEVLKDAEMLSITSCLQIFEKMCLQAITDSYKELALKFKDITSFYTKVKKGEVNLEEDDQSVQFFGSFYDQAAKSMGMLEEKIKGIDERYSTVIKFLGDTSAALSLETLIEIFKQFNKDLETTKANYTRVQQIKEKADKKK